MFQIQSHHKTRKSGNRSSIYNPNTTIDWKKKNFHSNKCLIEKKIHARATMRNEKESFVGISIMAHTRAWTGQKGSPIHTVYPLIYPIYTTVKSSASPAQIYGAEFGEPRFKNRCVASLSDFLFERPQ